MGYLSHRFRIRHESQGGNFYTKEKDFIFVSVSLGEMKGTARNCVHSATQTFRKHVSETGLSDSSLEAGNPVTPAPAVLPPSEAMISGTLSLASGLVPPTWAMKLLGELCVV